QDKWFYAFRYLAELDAIPSQLQEKVFLQLFEAANIAKFNPVERQAYEDSLKYYRDLKNVTDTARDEGKEEGIEIGMALGEQKAMKKTIKALKNSGMTVELIANSLSLSEVVVLELLKED
ncbi:MAG TPA: PD-(D/E)XK nuclease family transposase, partial [Agitococcus sp.]|nr:PD-(D/E)XK nuclease family transposase [Agitococcus sp.]